MPGEDLYIDLIVASERVCDWLQALRTGGSLQRRAEALQVLLTHVLTSPAYAEEARLAGAVDVLTTLLSQTDDQSILEAASKVIAACSGPLASCGQVREFTYRTESGTVSAAIREGLLSDGLGVRLWIAAHALCRELARMPQLVAGKTVLELGSGCALCGIIAAKLGAAQVTLSDNEPAALQNAAANMVSNAQSALDAQPSSSGLQNGNAGQHRSLSSQQQQQNGQHAEEAARSMWQHYRDLDDVRSMQQMGSARAAGAGVTATEEELDSADEALEGMWPAEHAPAAAAEPSVWASDNMRVRLLDWSHAPHGDEPVQPSARRRHFRQTSDIFHSHREGLLAPAPASDGSLSALQEDLLSSGVESAPVVDSVKLPQEVKTEIQATLPPVLDDDEKFDMIIGSDLLYEEQHAAMVAAVIAHRISPLGVAVLSIPVRDQEIWQTFQNMAMLHGLEITSHSYTPDLEDEGLCSEDKEYEGGFVMVQLAKTYASLIAASCQH